MNNPKCLFSSRGDCVKQISGEHVIPNVIIPSGKITVKGFFWCKEEKSVGRKSLVNNNLCEHHNSSLSPLDNFGKDYVETIDKFNKRTKSIRTVEKKRIPYKEYKLDGNLLEKLLLKLLINICTQKEYPIGIDSDTNGKPSETLIDYLYEGFFTYPMGIYMVESNHNIQTKNFVVFQPRVVGGNIVGGLFVFRGFQYYLHLTNEVVDTINKSVFNEDLILGGKLYYRREGIDLKRDGKVLQSIKFEW
ncbi:hypothetical protein ACKGJO_10415 [Gracilimonas sp. Q87]|uniref:hypothetical protein n=1 Tax=Gracilimonas sp. Q87 TaxID=3384766 RepID=UPI0039844DDF